MSKTTHWMLFLIVIACAGAIFFVLAPRETSRHQDVVQEPPPHAASQDAEVETLTRHPVPGPEIPSTAAEKPLPNLADSDSAIQESLGKLADAKRVDELLVFNNFIARLVVTIDNLPRSKLPVQRLPSKPPLGKFLVRKELDGSTVIDPENYKRYTRYVDFFEAMDSRRIAALYFHFYPLFQEAYEDLGYKKAYFNDRVVAAIDDLLATPDMREPINLIQPSVFYKFADPKLEGLSSGQRLMIRIGSDNAARVKVKLRELRDTLTKSTIPH